MLQHAFKPLIISLSLLALALFFYFAFRPQSVPVDLAVVQTGAMQVTIDEDGRTRVRDVYRLSAPITGHLLRINAEVGDSVTAGETILARLTPSDPGFLDRRSQQQAEAAVRGAEAALALARAELSKARSQSEYARTDLIRARELAADNTLSAAELERVELAAKTTAASLESARAAVKVRQAELANARALLLPLDARGQPVAQLQLRAPASGSVLRILQESEGVVAAGTPILEIGDPARLEVVVDLLSRDAVRVESGAEVRISSWGGEAPLSGSVRRVQPLGYTRVSALGIEEQRVDVVIDLQDPPARWRRLGHGYRVDVSILTWAADEVLIVPTSALIRDGENWGAFVYDQGRARLRTVRIGHNNGLQAEVLDGLVAREQVIQHPSERVQDGARVAIRPQ